MSYWGQEQEELDKVEQAHRAENWDGEEEIAQKVVAQEIVASTQNLDDFSSLDYMC
jgi:hypothetical protein